MTEAEPATEVAQIDVKVVTGSITLESGDVLQLPKGTFTVSPATMEAIVAFNKKEPQLEIQVKPGMTVTLTKPADTTNAKLLSLAYAVAALAHEGQINKDGTPYITHPLRLAARWEQFEPDNVWGRILALLHDTIEDTGITYDILRSLGFPGHLIDGIVRLTRPDDPKDWNIDQREYAYHAHIDELVCSNDREAVITKRFDLEDNMDITRLTAPLDEWSTRRTLKYHTAWLKLRDYA